LPGGEKKTFFHSQNGSYHITLTYKLDLYIPTCRPKIKFLGQDFQKFKSLNKEHTDRQTYIHTDATQRITTAAFAGRNKFNNNK